MAISKVITVKYTVDFKQRGYAFLQGTFTETGDPNDRKWIIEQIARHTTEVLRTSLDWTNTTGCFWSSDQLEFARGSAKPAEIMEIQAALSEEAKST